MDFVLGLDYISQEDILPYMISDAFSRPIHHELFDRFLYPEPGRGIKIHVINSSVFV